MKTEKRQLYFTKKHVDFINELLLKLRSEFTPTEATAILLSTVIMVHQSTGKDHNVTIEDLAEDLKDLEPQLLPMIGEIKLS
jgi:hypothetical protein